MRFGICGKLDEIDLIAQEGYDYLELRLVDLPSLREEEFEALKQKLATLGLKAEAFNSFFPQDYKLVGANVDLERIATYADHALARAKELGGEIAVLGNGNLRKTPEGEDPAACRAQFKKVVALCGDLAARHGMKIAIEPLNNRETDLIQTVQDGLDFCKELNHPQVGVLVDFFHAFINGETMDAVEQAGELLLHAHIARPNEDRGAPLPEDGAILERWNEALQKNGQVGRISLESRKTAGSLEERIKKMNAAKHYFGMIREDLIRVTDYQVLGKLPDPFLKADGKRICNPSEWEEHRRSLYKSAVELQYGSMPPAPEFLEVEKLTDSGGRDSANTYRILTGRREKPISFTMKVLRPTEGPREFAVKEKLPVAINGDLCFGYAFDKEFIKSFLDERIVLVLFNRTELAHDVKNEGRRKGALYDVYPEYTFGALGAWAWGYSRVIDALEQLDIIDQDCIAVTGHSRGGKTVALAGALDERIAIVNPNETNAGACSCYRIHMKAITEDGEERRSETLADIWRNFPFWFGEGMQDFTQREEELPFDCHFLKALIAPRILLVGEAASDIWTNPIGSWMTTEAAKEVWKFLGKPENLYWYYRKGYHAHAIEDIQRLVQVIKHHTEGRPLPGGFFETPFPRPERIFDWKAPKK